MSNLEHKLPASDSEGYLIDYMAWQPVHAELIAKHEGINLTPAHWQVINFLRSFYQNFQHTPPMRILVKALRKHSGNEDINSSYLYQLFPQSPAKQAAKIAGLPKPHHCL